jgi:pimeloyl-ACP methyl ester carboxylesterase
VTGREVVACGRKVWLLEEGSGPPLLYLHGFADVHSVKENWMVFHQQLAQRARLIAPAHPGCARTDENKDVENIEDVVFHYLEVLDALGLSRFDLAGSSIGGWIAAEIAVRHPEKVGKLVLMSATGLFVEGALIGDLFMMAQPERGSSYAGLRQMLFADAEEAHALELFPDGMGEIEDELRRYQMLRLGSRVGFKPPYFYNYTLRNRLHRITAPALIIWGEHDRMVPRAHGETYARLIPDAKLEIVAGAGHSVHVERPAETAKLVLDFLSR